MTLLDFEHELKAMEQIKKHEGYREQIYLDSVKVPTGGYGHAFHVGSILPHWIWHAIFDYDFSRHLSDTTDIIRQYHLEDIGEVRKIVLVDMCFNLGKAGLLKFQKMLAALQDRDFDKAAESMLNSLWYSQVGNRAKTLIKQMQTVTM